MGDFLTVEGVSRYYGGFPALREFSVEIAKGELVSFVGPSGAGKTTLLRLLAGIDHPTQGRIDLPISRGERGGAILVFQDYLLFPHMRVFENVAFGLRSLPRTRRPSNNAITARVMRYLSHLGIADKARAWPAQLSGGQKQRVALARALVVEPSVLLLDEPFANLDNALKRETASFIRRLQREIGVTTVIVSHDLEEASEISDRMGVIIAGRLEQIDRFEEIYFRPATLEVARMFGPVNVIPKQLYRRIVGRSCGDGGRGCARAEALSVVASDSGIARIDELHLIGGVPHYTVACQGWRALVRADNRVLGVGDRVDLVVKELFFVPDTNVDREVG